MKKVLSALALAASTMALAPAAMGQDIYRAVSSGPAESPPNGSPGSSIATFEVDGSLLRAEVPFRDLVAGRAAFPYLPACWPAFSCSAISLVTGPATSFGTAIDSW